LIAIQGTRASGPSEILPGSVRVDPVKRWLGIGVAMLALYAAPGANAAVEKAGGFSFVTEKDEVTGGNALHTTSESLSVECPGNTRVVSAGLTSDAGFDRFTYNGTPYDDGDRDGKPDDGWRFTGTNYAPGKVKFQGEAVCTKKLKPSYPTESEKLSAQSQSSVGVDCPGSRVAVGGGMSGRVGMNSSFPSADSWGMFADNYTNKKQEVRSFAVCVEPSLRLEFSSSTGTIGPDRPGAGFSSCFSGEVGISGGHSNSGGFSTIGIRGLNPSPGGFGYAIDNYSDQTISITTYTVCFDPSA
jgi:hypothetical protein